jgi:hypothetical protein
MQQVPIADIKIGCRHRKDFGDLKALAEDIGTLGLLQPIGITEDFELVFGERRLRACRDVLEWKQIPARIVNVPSIVAGEYSENELRKDFTPSERVAIAETLKQEIPERRGNPSNRGNCPTLNGRTDELAAKRAGFKNRYSYKRAKKVVENGSLKLVEAMDSGKIAISTAARLVDISREKQDGLLDLGANETRQAARAMRQQKNGAVATNGLHSNGHQAIQPNGSKRMLATAVIDHDSALETIEELKNHRDLMEQILAPVCGNQDVKMKPVEKRTVMCKLRETKDLYGRLERVLRRMTATDGNHRPGELASVGFSGTW